MVHWLGIFRTGKFDRADPAAPGRQDGRQPCLQYYKGGIFFT